MEPEVHAQCLLWDVDAQTREEAIDLLAEKLEKEGFISQAEPLLQNVYLEERKHAHLSPPLALAHGSSPEVNQPLFALAKLKKPIVWQGVPGIYYVGLMAHAHDALNQAESWCQSFGERFQQHKHQWEQVQSSKEAYRMLQ